MGRSWDAGEEWTEARFALWERSVENAAKGKRGQAFLRDLRAALLALPEKRLAGHTPVDLERGEVCAIGAYLAWKINPASPTAPETLDEVRRRVLVEGGFNPNASLFRGDGWDYEVDFSPELTRAVAQAANAPRCLVSQLQFENDEGRGVGYYVGSQWPTDEARWRNMLDYIESLIVGDA